MTTDNFRRLILDAIATHHSLELIRGILVEYKNDGGTQTMALDILEKMRHDEKCNPYEDVILETMDIVSGFCNSQLRVW